MSRPILVTAAIVLVAALGTGVGLTGAPAAGVAFPEPPAQPVVPHGTQVAVVAGGCFWGMEGLFEHVRGVKSVTSGYAGGTASTANYETVSSETTNHAESIRIEFDPAVVSYGRLLEVYFAVAHDPTQVNGQYPDEGRSYRSAIFPQSPAQRDLARQYIATLDHAHVFKAPIATRIETGGFYPAEEYHQQFMRRHPDHPYIRRWDVERVAHLRERFPQFYQ